MMARSWVKCRTIVDKNTTWEIGLAVWLGGSIVETDTRDPEEEKAEYRLATNLHESAPIKPRNNQDRIRDYS
jgi:hypothetical protein